MAIHKGQEFSHSEDAGSGTYILKMENSTCGRKYNYASLVLVTDASKTTIGAVPRISP